MDAVMSIADVEEQAARRVRQAALLASEAALLAEALTTHVSLALETGASTERVASFLKSVRRAVLLPEVPRG